MRIIVRAIPHARARRSHLRLCNRFSNVYPVMSIRNYFRPSNGLSESTGSISVALKSREHGTSNPPCARSAEYFLRPVTVYTFYSTSPSQEQWTHPWYLSRQMSHDTSFLFHSCNVSIGSIFGLSFAHQGLSNRNLPYFFNIRGSLEYSNFFRKTLPWQLLSLYVSSP